MDPKQDALTQLCLAVLPIWERQLATSRSQAETAVGGMLEAFSSLAPHLNGADAADAKVSADIEKMHIGFQYQDRINQMLALLQDDVGRLIAALKDPLVGAEALATTPWLARLESLYAMAEQHKDHGKPDGAGVPPGTDEEVSFF
jgi:hypothetical protein